MLRLVGDDPQAVTPDVVADNNVRNIIGNSISVNVLERTLLGLVNAAGPAPHFSNFADRWGSTA